MIIRSYTCLDSLYDSGRKSAVLQLVDAPDGISARRAHLLNLRGGMRVGIVLQQGGGAHHALRHHPAGVLCLEAQLDACLRGGLDVLHHVGRAARGEGGGGGQLGFGHPHRGAEGGEEVQHELPLPGVGGQAGDQRHALPDGGGGVGHDAEEDGVGHAALRAYRGEVVEDAVDAAPGHDRGHHQSVPQGQFGQYLVQHPRLDGEDDQVGVACRLDVGGGDFQSGDVGLQGLEFALRGIGYDDVFRLHQVALGQPAGDGAAHVARSDDGYLHTRCPCCPLR